MLVWSGGVDVCVCWGVLVLYVCCVREYLLLVDRVMLCLFVIGRVVVFVSFLVCLTWVLLLFMVLVVVVCSCLCLAFGRPLGSLAWA